MKYYNSDELCQQMAERTNGVTFNNSEQLREFLQAIGMNPADSQYIDGNALAKKLGIDIKTPSRPAPGAFKAGKSLKDLV